MQTHNPKGQRLYDSMETAKGLVALARQSPPHFGTVSTDIATLKINGELSGISIFFKNPGNENLPYRNIKIEREDFFNLNFPEDYRKAIEYLEK